MADRTYRQGDRILDRHKTTRIELGSPPTGQGHTLWMYVFPGARCCSAMRCNLMIRENFASPEGRDEKYGMRRVSLVGAAECEGTRRLMAKLSQCLLSINMDRADKALRRQEMTLDKST